MKFSVAAWNGNEAFGDKARQATALEHIKPYVVEGTAIVAISEACRENDIHPAEVMGALGDFAGQAGYRLYSTAYADKRPRANQPSSLRQYMAVLVNSELDQTTAVERLARRNALFTTAKCGEMLLEGAWIHLDDRGEDARLPQTDALLRRLNRLPEGPGIDIIAGDFNNLHSYTRRARVWRAAGFMAGLTGVMPEGPSPDRGGLTAKLERLDSILMRGSQMAEGATLQRLVRADFADADQAHQATHKVVGQLDHCMYRYHGVDAAPPLFQLGGFGPSDHRLILATFEW